VLLDQPAKLNYYGIPESTKKDHVPGVGINPLGFRMIWRDGKAIKPYLMAKGGVAVRKLRKPGPAFRDRPAIPADRPGRFSDGYGRLPFFESICRAVESGPGRHGVRRRHQLPSGFAKPQSCLNCSLTAAPASCRNSLAPVGPRAFRVGRKRCWRGLRGRRIVDAVSTMR
jgi:hypothetical protein